jgi:hypothetical protein
VLLTLQIFPIEESNFALAYGPLVAMLRDLIGRCDAVIHLTGLYYGAEPPQRPPGQRRRSYTQIEYDVARELKKPLYLFLATENYEPDRLSTQSEEENELQFAHRCAIEQCGDIYYWFANREELGSRIRELRFPARSEEAPRRVVNLPYNSLGPLFKGRDTALVDLRQRLMAREGEQLVSALAKQSMGWAAWAKHALPSNTHGATRVIMRMRCSLLVLAPRSICVRTLRSFATRWFLICPNGTSPRKSFAWPPCSAG